jgi:hypothetical protein
MKLAVGVIALFMLGSMMGCGQAADSAKSAPGHVWQMRKVSLIDVGASQPNLVAGSLLMPPDWKVRATGNYIMDCVFSPVRLVIQAGRPDDTLGLNIFPGVVDAWSDNPQVMQMYRTGYAEFAKTKRCNVKAPRSIDVALHEALGQLGAQPVGSTQEVPGLNAELRADVQRVNQELAQHPGSGTLSAEGGRIRFTATNNSKSVEGWLILVITIRTTPLPNGQGSVSLIDAPLICEMYAAPGQLDGNEKMLSAILGTIQVDPNWQRYAAQDAVQVQQMMQQAYARVADIHNQMMQDNLQTQRKIAAIRQGTADYARKVHSNVASDRAAALDHSAQQFSLYMGDQAIYKNPTTGEQVQMSSAYGHAWASSTGNSSDYVLTDSASYDPNGKVGAGTWTELQQER